jgi:ubiquinone/menaquinone biosynthesis C-methylase UbiE
MPPTPQRRPTALLRLVHWLTQLPGAYHLQQYLGYPTTSRFRKLLSGHVQVRPADTVLDLACGIGNYRELLGGHYFGADLNAEYIESARARYPGNWAVMDCSKLTYPDAMFDHVVTIAATHHLDAEQIEGMVSGAARVCRPSGAVHVIDAVLPETGFRLFKRSWFRMDAGRYPRTREDLRRILGQHLRLVEEDFLPGPLHDCVYFKGTTRR